MNETYCPEYCVAKKEFCGLERHLECCARINDAYKYLNGRWQTRKKDYEEQLSASIVANPGYSRHDASHSREIIESIERLLGEERIRILSPTDTWLLLECAYAHDLGMVWSRQAVVDEWFANFPKFIEFLKNTVSKNRILWEHLALIIPLIAAIAEERGVDITELQRIFYFRYDDQDKRQLKSLYQDADTNQVINFSNAMTSLMQEYMRKGHGINSKRKLISEISAFDHIDPALLKVIADVAEFHGEDIKKLDRVFKDNCIDGHGSDYAHPRFIAMLIRLGDLLDLAAGRFNKYIIEVTGNIDRSSVIHLIKHSGAAKTVTPRYITINAEYSEDKTRRVMRRLPVSVTKSINSNSSKELNELTIEATKAMLHWLVWLKEETEFFSVNWNEIAPKDFPGGAPAYKGDVYLNGDKVELYEIDLRYEINTKRAAEIIEGVSIYSQPGLVFLRETVQNAIDSTKRRLYKDMIAGRSGVSFSEDEDFFEFLKKMGLRMSLYRILVSTTLPNGGSIEIRIRDFGIGISKKSLDNMRHVGDIFDEDMNEMRAEMPVWLRPTGSFGLGMQSIFRNVKSFEIKSVPLDNLKKIGLEATLYTSRMGGEIYYRPMQDNVCNDFEVGAEIIITLEEDDITAFLENINHEREIGIPTVDLFADRREKVINVIEEYCREQFTFCGFIIEFSETVAGITQDKLDKRFNEEICSLFGDFIISQTEGKKLKVRSLAKNGFLREDDKLFAFSYWDNKHCMLTKFTPCYSGETPYTRIWFKGIRVEADVSHADVSKLVELPHNLDEYPPWSVDIHILGLEARDYLQVSRDMFLPEKRLEIAHIIQESYFNCLTILFSIFNNDGDKLGSNADDLYSAIDSFEFRLTLSKMYFSGFGILPQKLYDSHIIALQPASLYRISGNMIVPCMRTPSNINDLWYLNRSFMLLSDIDAYESSVSDNDTLIVLNDNPWRNYDALVGASRMHIFKIYNNKSDVRAPTECFRVLFTLTRRGNSTNYTDISLEAFMAYAKNLCDHAKVTPDSRLLLPGISEYKDIVVDEVPDAMKTSDSRMFMSWIILPFSVGEYREEKSKGTLLKVFMADDSKHLSSMLSWVIDHPLQRNDKRSKKTVIATYERLIKDIFL